MARAPLKKPQVKRPPFHPDAKAFFLISLAALALCSLWSFRFLEPEKNWLGYLGYIAALGTEYTFGLGAYLIPIYLFWLGGRLLKGDKLQFIHYDHLYFLVLIASFCLLLNVFAESFPDKASLFEERIVSEKAIVYSPYPRTIIRFNLGGAPFYYLFVDLPVLNLQTVLSPVGTTLIFSTLSLVSFLLLTRVRLLANLKIFAARVKQLIQWVQTLFDKIPAAPKQQYTGLPTAPKINLPIEAPKKKIAQLLAPKKPLEPAPKKPTPAPVVNIAPPKPQKETIAIPTKSLMVKSDSSYKSPTANIHCLRALLARDASLRSGGKASACRVAPAKMVC